MKKVIASTATAHKNKLREEIFRIIKNAQLSYVENGPAAGSKKDLRDAPEYFLTTHIAEGLGGKFKTLRYELEYAVVNFAKFFRKQTDVDFLNELKKAVPRVGGRFDLVLTGEKGLPRYAVEVKLGPKFANDIKRMACLAKMNHGRKRWNYGFVATLMRRSNADDVKNKIIEDLKTAHVESKLINSINFENSIRELGDSKIEGKRLFAFVCVINLSAE